MGKKIISFSLWGQDPKYNIGAIRNAELAKIYYPGWICKFYVGYSVYANEDYTTIDQLEAMANVQVIHMSEPGDWKSMFWRFAPAGDDDCEVFISRDCDSRLGAREAIAVQEWLDGPHLVLSLGDHPYHFNPSQALMGGMFGMKKNACPEMVDLIEQFIDQYPDAWQCDQDFLKDKIWPLVRHKVLAYSDLHSSCKPFPIKRQGLEFVGKVFLADGSTVIEHEQVLKLQL